MSMTLLLSEALDEDALTAKRKRWLEAHDQKTGGIMGLLPLVRGLPVRLTDHVDRGLGLFKKSKCTIHGWTLHENEATCLFSRARLIAAVFYYFVRMMCVRATIDESCNAIRMSTRDLVIAHIIVRMYISIRSAGIRERRKGAHVDFASRADLPEIREREVANP